MTSRIDIYDPFCSQQAQLWSMQRFLSTYTVHDSHLTEVLITPHQGILMLIDWDLHWNPAIPAPFQRLGVWFTKPYLSQWSQGGWLQSTLSDATVEFVSQEERKRMLEDGTIDLRAFQSLPDEIPPAPFDDTLTRTRFKLMNWSTYEVIHHETVKFGCFNDEGHPFAIPM